MEKTITAPIPYGTQTIDESDIAAIAEALRGAMLTQGPTVAAFEEALAEVTDGAYVTAVSNGTTALHLAAVAAGVQEGDLCICAAISFVASANCFLYAGADALFADVDPLTGNMTAQGLEEAIYKAKRLGKNPRACVAVSLAGRCLPLSILNTITERSGIALIEDAAQSLMASHGASISSSCKHSEFAALSFHPVKHICTGEGGAVLTRDPKMDKKLKLLRTHGVERPWGQGTDDPLHRPSWFYQQVELGWNYRLCDIQAALGLSQLKRAQEFLEKRRTLAARYDLELSHGLFSEHLSLAPTDPGHAYHLYVVHFANSAIRNRAHQFLKDKSILTQVHHVPIYAHPYYERRYGHQSLPGADKYFSGCLSLPLFPKFTQAQQSRVIEALHEFLRTL